MRGLTLTDMAISLLDMPPAERYHKFEKVLKTYSNQDGVEDWDVSAYKKTADAKG